MSIELGQTRMIRFGDTDYPSTVEAVKTLDDGRVLVWYRIPDYGLTQPYLYGEEDYREIIFENNGMPEEYAKRMPASFCWHWYHENTDVTKSYVNAFATEFMKFQEDGRGLYIYSLSKGSGKTLLACCLGNEIISRYKVHVKFINTSEYLERYRAHEDLSIFRNAPLLILDDIGSQRNDEYTNNLLYQMVNHRYVHKLCTIYTSNNPFDQTHPDDRIHSRIYAKSIPVKLPEEKIRERQADERTKEFLQAVCK